jgi:hypothetical protein
MKLAALPVFGELIELALTQNQLRMGQGQHITIVW